jgi:hypothetical protein
MAQIKKSYNGNELSVVFGITPLTGFVTGTSLIIEKPDDYCYRRDVCGNSTRHRVNNNSVKITLTLTKASSSNALLNSYMELDNQSNSGTFSIYVKDPNSDNIFISGRSSIMSNNEHWQDEGNEWVIMATNSIFK